MNFLSSKKSIYLHCSGLFLIRCWFGVDLEIEKRRCIFMKTGMLLIAIELPSFPRTGKFMLWVFFSILCGWWFLCILRFIKLFNCQPHSCNAPTLYPIYVNLTETRVVAVSAINNQSHTGTDRQKDNKTKRQKYLIKLSIVRYLIRLTKINYLI